MTGFLPNTNFADDISEEDSTFFIHGDDDSSSKNNKSNKFTTSVSSEGVVPKEATKNDYFPSNISIMTTESEQSDGLPPSPVITKSAIKMNYDVQDIPVCMKRRSWKTLPPPNMKQVEKNKIKRIESMSSFFHHYDQSLSSSPPRTTPTLKKSDSKVSFNSISIREYSQTLGDNPSVSYGPPISLDWEYSESQSMCVNEYEGSRPKRRSLRQMGLNYYQRKHVLAQYGHTEEEMKKAKNDVKKAKSQRSMTKELLKFQKLEDVLESAGRKIKRFVGGGERDFTGSNNDKLMSQQSSFASPEEEIISTPEFSTMRRCVSAPALTFAEKANNEFAC